MRAPETAALAFAAATLSLAAAQVYSVPDGERIYPGYAVEVDGAKAPVSEVRCSAIPFNRRWPGHQRQIEQTELCGMARFAFDGKATVSVTAARDFKTVKIRPLSHGVQFRRDGRTVTFDIVRPGGYSVEFDGLHNNLHVFADAAREYDLPADALRFGPGEHEIGIRELKSGDTVYLDPGAVVYGGFHAFNATNVAILGRGVIDMSRIKEKILFPATGDGHKAVKNAKRVHTIMMRNCRNVRIDGVTIRDSLCYNIALWGCEDVAVGGVKIVGQWRFNTDGIDLHNCRRARISDCFARTYDDTFCFKAHEGYGNCEDCVFERCVAWNDWGKAFEVGVECRANHMRRLEFRDCDCIHAAGWAMDVTNCDYGRVSDVVFDSIRIEADEPMPAMQLQKTDDMPFDPKKGLDAPPRLFQAKIQFHHEYSRESGGKWSGGGFIDGVTLRDVAVVTGGRKPQVAIVGIDERHRPENVVFEGLAVDGDKVSDARGVHLDLGAAAVPPRFHGGGANALSVAAAALHAAPGEASSSGKWPFIVIRHTSALNDRPDMFRQLADCHRRHRRACDEFWFAGGGRKAFSFVASSVAKFAAFRPLCDETGVLLSYQQGMTLGHGAAHDGPAKPGDVAFPQDAWQCDRAGNRLCGIFCPRSPEVLAYQRKYVKTVLNAARPASYWLDDDLRLGIHKPDGCFCDRCIAAFNAKSGGEWTRESLAAKIFSKAVREPVRAAWLDFNAESLAIFAAASRRGADDAGVPCRLGYQAVWADTIYTGRDFRPVLEALAGPARRQVGIRPGAGFYVEAEPRGMVKKCLSVAREAERCRRYDGLVASVCYEQETYPRRVLHKSPGAIMTECALALASGCDALSLYWYSASEPEPIEEYDRFLKTLSSARPYFERLAASTRRTHLGGVARFVGSAAAETVDFDLRDPADFDLACAGIPVTVMESSTRVWYVTEKSRREMAVEDKALLADGAVVDVEGMGRFPLASRRRKLMDDLDAATGGTFPVRIDACRPLRILPRVRDDGRLDSVTILNCSIGDTDAFAVRVRRPISRQGVLWGLKEACRPFRLASGAIGNEGMFTISNIPGWGIVTLFFDDQATANIPSK